MRRRIAVQRIAEDSTVGTKGRCFNFSLGACVGLNKKTAIAATKSTGTMVVKMLGQVGFGRLLIDVNNWYTTPKNDALDPWASHILQQNVINISFTVIPPIQFFV
ncbi:hypothetical protein X474_05565 [Dethiosulfatarculus sandiegensis]|uniref:Uncharacterized protein n=1 Tax=Dethiosulfatarculus sandiegensis TaxID=1429043 RepID=A0A0D2JH28_9BACT|nr:hypothetical protein X474_05565 [Dethiosulfatarculus sandiegensis]